MIVNDRGETYEQEQARGRAERLETARKLRARGAPFTANEQAVIHCNLDAPNTSASPTTTASTARRAGSASGASRRSAAPSPSGA